MLWLSLRTGFGNTAFIAVLALLPLIAFADLPTRHDLARSEAAVAAVVLDNAAIVAPDAAVTDHGIN